MQQQDRPAFRYPNTEAILRRLAHAHGLTYEAVVDAPYGTEGFYLRKQAIGLADGSLVVKNGVVACATCGGNCGQCGMTDTLGNIGFDFQTVVDSAHTADGRPALRMIGWPFNGRDPSRVPLVPAKTEPAYEKGDPWYRGATGPIDEERPQAMPNLIRKLAALPLLGKLGFVLLAIVAYLPIIAAVMAIVAALSGCTTMTRVDPCERCIGPYDPALRSHREAIIDTLKD